MPTKNPMNRIFQNLILTIFLIFVPIAPLFSKPAKPIAPVKKDSQEKMANPVPALLEEIKKLKTRQEEQEKKIRTLEEIKGVKEGLEKHEKAIQKLTEDDDVNQTEIESIDHRLDQSLKINGYFDLEYHSLRGFQDGSASTFDQSHTALFFQLQSDHWQFFSEMEWEHSGRKLKQERAWVKYGKSPNLETKMGHFLTPTYWNLNHYPTVATAISEPDISRKILPWDLTGIYFKKALQTSPARIDLHFYVGNGFDENPKNPGRDLNENKAVGLKFSWENNDTSSPLAFGLNLFHDNRNQDLTQTPVTGSGRYEAYLFESSYKKRKFAIHVSYGGSRLRNTSRKEGRIDTSGWYAEPSFNLTRLLTLFFRVEDLEAEKGVSSFLDRAKNIVGLNYRPFNNTVAKLEFLTSDFHQAGKNTEKEINMAVSVGF